jgi:hypothetical protein
MALLFRAIRQTIDLQAATNHRTPAMTSNPYAPPTIPSEARPAAHRRGARITFVVVAVVFLLLAAGVGYVTSLSTSRQTQDRLAIVLIVMNAPGIVPMVPLRLTVLRDLHNWPEWSKHVILYASFVFSALVWGWLGSVCYRAIAKRTQRPLRHQ